MKIVSKICLYASLVLLTSGLSGNVTMSFDRTAEVGEGYSAPAVYSLDLLSKLDEKIQNPMTAMPQMNHQIMMAQSDDMDPMEKEKDMDHDRTPDMSHDEMAAMDNSRTEMDHDETDRAFPWRKARDTHPLADEHDHDVAHTYSIGEPASAAEADRTVRVVMADTMTYTFTPVIDFIQNGEVINFVFTNHGKINHEFSIGNQEDQQKHVAMMSKMPNMVHDDPNTVTVLPGETKFLTWRFMGDDLVVFACNIPGHYQAGMFKKVAIVSAEEHADDVQ